MKRMKMTISEAVGFARRTLAEHYNLVLIDGKMHGDTEAANAYNKLASAFWYYDNKEELDKYHV